MNDTTLGAPVTIDRHRILCGDLMRGDVARLMGGERAQVIYCDPPWGDAILKFFYRHAAMDAGALTWSDFIARWVHEARAHLAEGGTLFVEMGNAWKLELCERLFAAGFEVVWDVPLTYRTGSEVLPSTMLYAGPAKLPEAIRARNLKGLHGVALPRACLASVADRYPGGIVLDPCCGKGFTARAARELGFAFRGLELNPSRLEVTEAHLRKPAAKTRGAR